MHSTENNKIRKSFFNVIKIRHKQHVLIILFEEWSGINWDPDPNVIIEKDTSEESDFYDILYKNLLKLKKSGKDILNIVENIESYLHKTWDEITKDEQYKNAISDHMKEYCEK